VRWYLCLSPPQCAQGRLRARIASQCRVRSSLGQGSGQDRVLGSLSGYGTVMIASGGPSLQRGVPVLDTRTRADTHMHVSRANLNPKRLNRKPAYLNLT
jgi:uncharacterized protein (AIM24 family)